MKTYKMELTSLEVINIEIALDKRLTNLFVRMEKAEDPDEIQYLDDQIENCKNLARKISKETRD